MSKSSELTKTAQNYIIDCIDSQSYDVETKTEKEKVSFLWDCFNKEYWIWRKKQQANLQETIKDYFQGLPTICTIEFRNYAILEMAVKWGSLPSDYTEKQADRLLENYWNFMAMKTLMLFNKYDLVEY